jgi:hypothetical protein
MKIQWPRIEHPIIALGVYFVIGIVLLKYGYTDGTMLILDIFLGMAIYKLIISWIRQ